MPMYVIQPIASSQMGADTDTTTTGTAPRAAVAPRNYTMRILTNPTARERAVAENVIAHATTTNPFLMMCINNNPIFAHLFARCFLTAGLLEGSVHVLEDDAGEIVALNVWFGPGKEFLETELQKEQALEPMLACFDGDLRDWWNMFLKEYHDMLEESLGPGVLLDSWHCLLCAVHPMYHRRGFIRRLVEFGLKQVKTAGTAVTIEPCGGDFAVLVPYMERLGFKTMGCRVFRGPKGVGEGKLYAMVLEREGVMKLGF